MQAIIRIFPFFTRLFFYICYPLMSVSHLRLLCDLCTSFRIFFQKRSVHFFNRFYAQIYLLGQKTSFFVILNPNVKGVHTNTFVDKTIQEKFQKSTLIFVVVQTHLCYAFLSKQRNKCFLARTNHKNKYE